MKNKFSLTNPELSGAEVDVLMGSLVGQLETDRLRDRYRTKLRTEHGVERNLAQRAPRRMNLLQISSIVAAVAACILFFFLPASSPSVSDYIVADDLVTITVRGEATATEADMLQRQQLMAAVRTKDWPAAVVAGVAIADKTPADAYFTARSLIHTGAYETALPLLTGITDDTRYGQDAAWYRALVLMQIGRTEEGVAQLRTFTVDHPYYQKAIELIETEK